MKNLRILGRGKEKGTVNCRVDASEIVQKLLGLCKLNLALVHFAGAKIEESDLSDSEEMRFASDRIAISSLASNLSEKLGCCSIWKVSLMQGESRHTIEVLRDSHGK